MTELIIKTKKNIERIPLDWVTAVLSVVILYILMGALGITCPIKHVTGVSCAGCGMTRAWLTVLSGDVAGAFYYHPLFILPLLFVICFFLKKHMGDNVYKGIILVMVAMFIVCYAIRLMDPSDTIVVFSPEKGAIIKFIDIINQV